MTHDSEKNLKKDHAQYPSRPTWDEFWLMQTLFYSTRGTCDRLKTGCVIVDEHNRLISAGYNGSLPGADHCDEAGHLMIDGHCMRTLHAEENALLRAPTDSLLGATSYALYSPCIHCAKKLLSLGIKRIIYAKEFGNMHGQDKGWEFVRSHARARGTSMEHVPIDFDDLQKKMLSILKGPGGMLRE